MITADLILFKLASVKRLSALLEEIVRSLAASGICPHKKPQLVLYNVGLNILSANPPRFSAFARSFDYPGDSVADEFVVGYCWHKYLSFYVKHC